MRVYLTSRGTDNVVQVNVHGTDGAYWISKRQYDSALARLGAPEGDYLRIAPVGNDPGSILVRGRGDNPVAVIE